MKDLRDLVSYRNRAEELRTMAEDFRNDENREALLKVANAYDAMAEALEREVLSTA